MPKITEISPNLIFYGTVKGLISEREKLAKVIEETKPEIMAISISEEELEGLRQYVEKPYEIDLSDYETIYAMKLKEFGEVAIPPPSYLEAFARAQILEIPLIALDMDDEQYADIYTDKVSIFDLIKHSLRKKRLMKKKFKTTNPEDFAIAWDNEMTKIYGYNEIEKEREKYMVKKLKKASSKESKKMLVVMDIERMDGVISKIV